MERIGIFGGTFNPPHLGHVQAAAQAIHALHLDRLLLMPNLQAPHKQLPSDMPTPEQRMEMLRLAAEGPQMEVCDLELKRPGPSYSYETVLQLREAYPDAQLVLLMGSDMFLNFHTWKNPGLILENCSIGVFSRGLTAEEEAMKRLQTQYQEMGHQVQLLHNPVLDISSTQLRRLLVFRGASAFLPEKVEAYIRDQGLYGTGKDYRNLPAQELEQEVVKLLKADRVAHVLGCRDAAVSLAERWGADSTDARRAALLHDITKALDGRLQLELCRAYGVELDEFSLQYPKTLHALTGSLVADRIFGENRAVVDAICCHTTGKADMTLLDKIIYVADYMEPNRNFPGVEELRRLTEVDMTQALICGLKMTIDVLKKQGSDISPGSREALEFLGVPV